MVPAPVVPSRISVMLVEETSAGDTSRPECPCDDQERQPLAGTNGPLGGTVSEGDTRSLCGGGGGVLPPSGTAGRLLLVDVTKAPALSVEGPRSVPSRISVVLVDGTMAGDTRSLCGGGGGVLPPSGTAGRLLLVDVTKAPALSVEGPRSVPSRISVVLVDGTMAGMGVSA